LITSARPPATSPSARTPPLADRLEAWGAAFVFGMFKLLPLDCASALGGALARGIGPFLGVSKHARCNISRALPGLSETQIAGVVNSMWDNLGRLVAEYPHLRKIRVFEAGGRVETHGFEHVHSGLEPEITHFRASFAPVKIREPWRKCSNTRCNPIIGDSFDCGNGR
jgi:lauroyl/myristoyl acyltransferase